MSEEKRFGIPGVPRVVSRSTVEVEGVVESWKEKKEPC